MMVLTGIKMLTKAPLWHISRLNNQTSMHKFGSVAEKWTKAAILAGYNVLAKSFASRSHFLIDLSKLDLM